MKLFDDIIQEKANNHRAPVPASAWDNIIKKKKKKRFAFFWLTFLFLLLGGIAFVTYFNTPKNNSIKENKTITGAVTVNKSGKEL